MRSLATAFTFGTVLPVPSRLHAAMGRGTMTALPVVGAALGAVAAAVTWGSGWAFGFAETVGGLDDKRVGVAAEFGLCEVRTSAAGVGEGDRACYGGCLP